MFLHTKLNGGQNNKFKFQILKLLLPSTIQRAQTYRKSII